MRPMVLETFTADYTTVVHHARRADGQWFTRCQERGPWGPRYTVWRKVAYGPERGRETGRTARLPAG